MLEQRSVHAQHDAAIHGNEAAVGVESKSFIAHGGGQTFNTLVVEAQVEHRVHHAGHGELGSGAHRHQQRILGITELATHLLFDLGDLCGDLGVE